MKTPSFAALFLALSCLSSFSSDIHSAAGSGDVQALEQLLRGNASLLNQADASGATPLHHAARSGKMEATEFLLKVGANMEAENSDKHTPLFCALHSGKVETSTLLIDRGAQVTGVDKNDGNVLVQAVRGARDLIPVLVQKGADVNHVYGNPGITLLHMVLAWPKEDIELLDTLLRHGANVNALDSNGDSALHYAARKGHSAAARLLVEKGADPNRKNLFGFRPLDLVQGKQNDTLASFLQERTISRGHEKGPALVGELGDTALLVFEGNSTFSDAQLRRGLESTASYLLASHRQSRLGTFLGTLEHKITSGYLAGGFPKPSVEASYDEKLGRVRVKITEGQRFNAGKVSVTGVAGKLQREIQNRLTKPANPGRNSFSYAPAAEANSEGQEAGGSIIIKTGVLDKDTSSEPRPPWQTGKPVGFDPKSTARITSVVKTCLADEGFFFPKVTVDRKVDAKTKTAGLVVWVQQGPSGTIVEINVTGNKRDSRTEILDYVGLKPGLRANRELFEKVERTLWDSARYMEWTIESQPVVATGGLPGGVRLDLDVRENDIAPRLAEPLREDQQALVRCAKWIQETTDDLIVDIKSTNLNGRIVISRTDGVLINAALTEGGRSYAGWVSKDSWGIYPAGSSYRLETAHAEVTPTAFIQALPSGPHSPDTWNFSMGTGFSSASDKTKPSAGFQLRISIPPAALLKFPRDAGRVERGVLTFSTNDTTLRIDSKTGRILDLTTILNESVRFYSGNGVFKAAWKQVERDFSRTTNRLANGSHLAELTKFGLTELVRAGFFSTSANGEAPGNSIAVAAAAKLLGDAIHQATEPITLDCPGAPFHVPADAVDERLAGNSAITMFAALIFKYSNIFPKYSWPWTVARESVFVLGGESPYVDTELQRLHDSEDTGPIASLLIAQLLARINSPSARIFAIRGLTHLSVPDFEADCKLLLTGDSGAGRTFAAVAANLRDLSDSEIEGLALSLPPAEATLLKECREALRLRPSDALLPVLRPALERYWQKSLRDKVRSGLQNIARPPLKNPSQT